MEFNIFLGTRKIFKLSSQIDRHEPKENVMSKFHDERNNHLWPNLLAIWEHTLHRCVDHTLDIKLSLIIISLY